MSYSEGFKINVNKLSSEESLVSLVEIDHPFLTDPVRLINDSRELEFLGERFIPMPFMLERQDDVQGELPKVMLTVSNVGRELIKWVDASNGGRDAKVTIYLTRRSNPVMEEKLVFQVGNINVTTEQVSFTLLIQNNLVKRSVRWEYDQVKAKGLFL